MTEEPSWKRLIRSEPEDITTSVPNALEYTYLAIRKGLFTESECCICLNGEVLATLTSELITGSHRLSVIWQAEESWNIEQEYPKTSEGGYLKHFKASSIERVLLLFSATLFGKTLMVAEVKCAETRYEGTRIRLYFDERLAGEAVPVWRDSDSSLGIRSRAFVDSGIILQRQAALILLTLGFYQSMGGQM